MRARPLAGLPQRVTVVEVGPRDGLQAESTAVPTEAKVRFVELLADAGLPVVEATAFVSPKAVPQLADAEAVLVGIRRRPGTRYPVLVPNRRGLERALAAGATEVSVFTAATETFCQRNTTCSIAESLERIREVVAGAREAGVLLRGYVSCSYHCPYEGRVPPQRAARVALALLDLGIGQVSLGDTIGWATPAEVVALGEVLLAKVGSEHLAFHGHDTRGTALANVLACLQLGLTTFDVSAGGLGGCPFAPGAAGNLATEDLVYLLDGLGIETRVDLRGVVTASRFIAGFVPHALPGRYYQAAMPQSQVAGTKCRV